MVVRTLEGYTQGRPEVTSTYQQRRPSNLPPRTEFSKGMELGLRSLQSGAYGAAQQFGDVVNSQGIQDFGREGYERAQEAMSDPAIQLNQPDVTQIDWKDPSQIMDWAGGVLGQTVPYAASMIGGGLVGRALAPISGVSRKVGAGTGALAATAPVESGNIYKEIEEESGIQAPGTAAVAGLASGALNLAAPATALSRNATGNLTSRIARKGAETAVVESGTEALQEGTALGARAFADDQFDPFSEQELPTTQNRLINAAAGGAVGGGVMGGLGGLLPPRRQADPNESFEDRYEKYIGPADGSPAYSLVPEDEASPLNQAMTPIVDAYRRGDIDRDTMLQNMEQLSETYELDPIIMSDIGRRIADVDSQLDNPNFGDGVEDLDSSVDNAENDITFEDFDQAESEVSSLTMAEFQPDGRIYTPPTGMPWNQARQDEGRVAQRIQELEAADPGTRFDQVSWYDAAREMLSQETDNEVELNDRLDTMAIELAARNREPLPVGVRPAEYLRRQAAIQAVGRVGSGVAPLESQISDIELNQGYVSPQELQERGRMNRRIKVLEERTTLSPEQRMELNELKRQSRRISDELNNGGILTRAPSTRNKSRDQIESTQFVPVKVDGKDRAINMPRLTRRMMGASDVTTDENTPMVERLRTYVTEGLGELAAKGVPVPSSISPKTIVFNGADGRKYTFGEVFPESSAKLAKDNINVGRARARVANTAAELRKLSTVKLNIMSQRGIDEQTFMNSKGQGATKWRRDYANAERQYNDAISQLRGAEKSAPRRQDLARRPMEGDSDSRVNYLTEQQTRREERRDDALVNQIEFAEGEVANEGTTIDNPATAAISDTTPRRTAVEGGRSVPTDETDPAPIRRQEARGDDQFITEQLNNNRDELRAARDRLRRAEQSGYDVPAAQLEAMKLEVGRLEARKEYLEGYAERGEERLEYEGGMRNMDLSRVERYGSTIPPSSPVTPGQPRQMQLPEFTQERDTSGDLLSSDQRNELAARSEAIKSSRTDTIESVLSSDTPNKRERLNSQVRQTLERVGLGNVTVKILSTQEAINAFIREGTFDAAEKIRNGSLHGAVFGAGKNMQMYIHPKLTGQLRKEIVAHEFGHVIYRAMIDAASPTVRVALFNDFKRWAAKYGDKTVDQLLRSKKLTQAALTYSAQGLSGRNVKELGENAQAYLLDFEEWMADRISKVIANNSSVKGPVRQFFDALIEMIRKVAAQFNLAETAVSDFMKPLMRTPDAFRSLFQESINQVTMVDGPFNMARENATALLAAARTMLTDAYSKVSEQAAQYSISQLPEATRSVIERAVNDTASIRSQVAKYGDVTAGKAYQLWRAGKLKAGPKLEQAFKRMTQALDDINTANVSNPVTGEIDALLKVPNRTAFSEIQQDLQGDYAAIEPQRRFIDKALSGLKSTFFIADERLRATNIPALQELANMLHKKVGQQVAENTMQTDKQIVKGRWDARARQIFDGKSAEFGDQVLRVMYRPETLAGADPEVQLAANKLFGLMRSVRDYLVESGVELGDRGPNYFPWVVDMDKMTVEAVAELENIINRPQYQAAMDKELERVNAQRRKQKIREISMEEFKSQVLSNLKDNDGYVDSAPMENGVDLNPVSPTPYMRSMNRRVLGFLQDIGTPEDKEFMASLMQEDMGLVLSNYFNQAAKRGEFSKRFGDDKFDKLLAKAIEQGATNDDIELATDYVNATMGLHGRKTALFIHDKFEPLAREAAKLKRKAVNMKRKAFGQMPIMQDESGIYSGNLLMPESGRPIKQELLQGMGAVMVYQNLRTLALATFTSLADFMGIAVRTGEISSAFIAMKEGFKSVVLNGGNDDLSVIAETLGIIDYGVVNEALGWEYGGAYLSGTARNINEGFFKWIGLQGWTRTSRVMGTSAAMRFLAKHATKPTRNSERFLTELGVSAADIKVDENGNARILGYAERKTATAEELAADDRVRSAIVNFVDESILRPNPSMRPLWASDPHYMLVFHLKSFMYAFHDRILKRVYNEATEHGNFGPLGGLMMYIPVMIAADLMRDIAANGGEEDPEKENWGMMDYAVDGAFRAGLPGVPGLIGFDVYRDYQYGNVPGVSLLGPTAEQILNPPEFNKWVPGQQIVPDVEFE